MTVPSKVASGADLCLPIDLICRFDVSAASAFEDAVRPGGPSVQVENTLG